MTYYTYILYATNQDKYYIGQTSNIHKRLSTHNSFNVKSTKAFAPWTLVWKCEKESRSQAIILERKLKNLNRKRLLDFIEKYS